MLMSMCLILLIYTSRNEIFHMMFDIKDSPKQISKVTMVEAQDWWCRKGFQRLDLLHKVNTSIYFDEKQYRCIFQYNKSYENVDIIFIIEFKDGSFLDVRTFRILNYSLTRMFSIQCFYKNKSDLIRDSKAFEFALNKPNDGIKFSNIQFDNKNNLCYGLVKQIYFKKTKTFESIYY